MRVLLVCAAALVGVAGCASAVPSPVGMEYRSSYRVSDVRVALPEEDKVPDRYDTSVNRIIGEVGALPADTVAAFRHYAADRGGLTEDNSGELFLEFLVQTQLQRQMPGTFTGGRDAALDVEITGTTFPNAATMLLVGEIIGTNFEFTLRDSNGGVVLVETVEPLMPFVQRSAGAMGGMLGLALRGGEDRHLMDLERIADAIVFKTMNVLGGQSLPSTDIDRISVRPIPNR